MIHMEIAYRLLQYLPQVEYPAEFILGSVAPDAVHMDPHFDVDRKVKSHLFEDCGPWGDTQDYARWRRNIETFFEKAVAVEAEPVRRDFALGICIHCLTDYWNDLRIWREAQRLYLPAWHLRNLRKFIIRSIGTSIGGFIKTVNIRWQSWICSREHPLLPWRGWWTKRNWNGRECIFFMSSTT